jgi:transposase, IS30 family
MSKNYSQLSLGQRYQIEALHKAGKKQKEIAVIIGVHSSTISRELKRNTPRSGMGAKTYWADNAQRRTDLRHHQKRKACWFDAEQKQFCRDRLRTEKYSPELISAEGKKRFHHFVSYETIYLWIWRCKKSNKGADKPDRSLYKDLRHACRKRKRGNRNDKRGNVPGRVFIENRPKLVDHRKRLGDMEVDLMIGQKHRSAILVCLDRCTRKLMIRKLKNKESNEVTKALLAIFSEQQHWIKTMTFDNDTAFTQHLTIAKNLCIKTYFTRPYTSQDKGSVENRIGVLRRFLPKSTDLSKVSTKQLQYIEDLINNRPMKLFNFKTPNQLFSEKIALIS